jgi:hypothetical protein
MAEKFRSTLFWWNTVFWPGKKFESVNDTALRLLSNSMFLLAFSTFMYHYRFCYQVVVTPHPLRTGQSRTRPWKDLSGGMMRSLLS